MKFQSSDASRPLTHSTIIDDKKRNGDLTSCDGKLEVNEKYCENGSHRSQYTSGDELELVTKPEDLKHSNGNISVNGGVETATVVNLMETLYTMVTTT